MRTVIRKSFADLVDRSYGRYLVDGKFYAKLLFNADNELDLRKTVPLRISSAREPLDFKSRIVEYIAKDSRKPIQYFSPLTYEIAQAMPVESESAIKSGAARSESSSTR